MKKFYFSLERVLSYKQQIEDSLRSEHGQAVRNVQDKQAVIDRLEQEFQSARKSIELTKEKKVSVTELKDCERYIEGIISRIASEKKELLHLKELEAQKRERVIEAKKETASIQNLKDKRSSEYGAMIAKMNEIEIEEFVSNRILAKQRMSNTV